MSTKITRPSSMDGAASGAPRKAVEQHAASVHRVAVIDAYHRGLRVPDAVLADYPELRGAA